MVLKRGNVYYLRLHVPVDLQESIGKAEIVKTLGTESRVRARRIDDVVSDDVAFMWKDLRREMAKRELTKSEIDEMVKSGLREMLAGCEDARVERVRCFDGPYNPAPETRTELDETLRLLSTLVEFFKGELALSHKDHELRSTACREIYCIGYDPSDIEPSSMSRLMRELGKSRITFFETELARLQGDYSNPYDAVPKAVSFPAAPVAPVVPEVPLLSEVIQTWLDESSLNCKPGTLKDYGTYQKMALRVLPNIPVDKLERRHFIEAIKQLEKLESNHGKPFSRRSIEKYATGFAIIMNHAVSCGFITSSPVPPIKKQAEVGDDSEWKPFKDAGQIKDLLDLVRGHKNSEYLTILRVLVYSGMRLNEAVMLRAEDVEAVGDVLCFQVRGEHLKNKNSRRLVPVHSAIQGEVSALVWKVGAGRLFPEVKDTSISKVLNRLIKKVSDSGQVVHSLRKWAASSMQAADVEQAVIAAILGHAPTFKMTGQYTGKHSATQLALAVEAIKV